jgi:hypothetical protein
MSPITWKINAAKVTLIQTKDSAERYWGMISPAHEKRIP